MTDLRFVFRVTMRRLDLANEIHHIKIDASLHIIRVEQGKGRKDRHVMLSPELTTGTWTGNVARLKS